MITTPSTSQSIEKKAWSTKAGKATWSKTTLGKEMDYIVGLGSARTITDLKQRILMLLRKWGFSDFAYHTMDLLDHLEDSLLTISKEQQHTYTYEAFYECDMIAEYICVNQHPIYNSVIEQYVNSAPFATDTILRNQEMFRMVKRYGFEDWYMVPMRLEGAQTPAVFSVSAKNNDPLTVQNKVSRARKEIVALAHAVNYLCNTKFRHLFSPDTEEGVKKIMNARPLQVLQALGSGECPTLKAVANKLDLSIDTVNQHVAAAREALGATSTYNAVCIASRMGIIKID